MTDFELSKMIDFISWTLDLERDRISVFEVNNCYAVKVDWPFFKRYPNVGFERSSDGTARRIQGLLYKFFGNNKVSFEVNVK
jgi:hypothetical protein